MLKNGLEKKNVRYSLNEISQDVKTPAEAGSTKSRQKGLH